MKRPSFQFYPGDWLEDIGLRASCLAARGLWADMLCFAHQGEPYGHLRKNGRDISPADLARMVGAPPGVVAKLLRELEEHHVFSRTEAGTIFSRRQVRDEILRERRAEWGREGGPKSSDNPNASRPGDARKGGRPGGSKGVPETPLKGVLKNRVETPPSSSSSSPPTDNERTYPAPSAPAGGGVSTPTFPADVLAPVNPLVLAAAGNGNGARKGAGAATARELAALEADPELAALGDVWVKAFRRPRLEIGVLRAARAALAGGYATDSLRLVIRVAALAREAPERFPDRGSIRWAVEHGKAGDPGYLLRPATLDRLIPEAEAWDRS